ncbi:MAG: hypothetical protein OD811_03615 [Alphaproteobacteria bacterium]
MTFSAAPFYAAFDLAPGDMHEAAHRFHLGGGGRGGGMGGRLDGDLGELLVEARFCRFIVEGRSQYDMQREVFARFSSPGCVVSRSPGGRLCFTWSDLHGHGSEAEVLRDLERLADFLSAG